MSKRGTSYLKSALTGIITAVLALAAFRIITYTYWRLWMLADYSPTDTYFEVIHINILSVEVLTTITVLFLAGAYWMFRRLRLQRAN